MPRPRKPSPQAGATGAEPGPHIVWRERGGRPRAYGDFRAIGGGKEALRPPGQTRATSDPELAAQLFAVRLKELTAAARWGTALPVRDADLTGLAEAVTEFLRYLREETDGTAAWTDATETMLGRAVEFFGARRPLVSIDRGAIRDYIRHLRTIEHAHGTGLSNGSIRHHLHALSRLYLYAPDRGWVADGVNPIRRLRRGERPGKYVPEQDYLTTLEAARLIEAARTFPIAKSELMRLAHPLVTALLCTGGRADEVLGLEVGDVDLEASIVHFRATPYRRGAAGKTELADRIVPLWPQLREALEPYLRGGFRQELELRFLERGITTTLLFPSPTTGGRFTDLRKIIDRCAVRAGLAKGRIRSRVTRRTYATARSATLWAGQPIPEYVVIQEMGHRDSKMLSLVYRKASRSPHRAEVVEYRLPNGSIHGANHPSSPPVASRSKGGETPEIHDD